jgi:predicted RNase H-like HicB family nuclease
MSKRLTAVIHRDGDGFVALCPEFDIASQGETVEMARDNLCEPIELFFGMCALRGGPAAPWR